ncbi:hypothetical protein Tco_1206585, partial [Tanacetum coccineum]
VKTQAEKLGIPSPPELTAVGISASEKKRKRSLYEGEHCSGWNAQEPDSSFKGG